MTEEEPHLEKVGKLKEKFEKRDTLQSNQQGRPGAKLAQDKVDIFSKGMFYYLFRHKSKQPQIFRPYM
jgi:hypothetical protein